ncbi:MAG: ABC transporter permease [[Clostridium] scindens]
MGQFGEYIKMALYNLKENKGRSFLTMLGIIIGISSVITIISIGNGLKADVMETDEPKSVTVKVDEEETDNLQADNLGGYAGDERPAVRPRRRSGRQCKQPGKRRYQKGQF